MQKLVVPHIPLIRNRPLSKLHSIQDPGDLSLRLNLTLKPEKLVRDLHTDQLCVLLSTFLDFTVHIKRTLISSDCFPNKLCIVRFK